MMLGLQPEANPQKYQVCGVKYRWGASVQFCCDFQELRMVQEAGELMASTQGSSHRTLCVPVNDQLSQVDLRLPIHQTYQLGVITSCFITRKQYQVTNQTLLQYRVNLVYFYTSKLLAIIFYQTIRIDYTIISPMLHRMYTRNILTRYLITIFNTVKSAITAL